MYDPLLYQKQSIPVTVIQKIVADEMDVMVKNMLLKNKDPEARKRERVVARQISMVLSKRYGQRRLSFAKIGYLHGARDHATVMHAIKVLNNAFDTNYHYIIDPYLDSEKRIKQWLVTFEEKRTGVTVQRKRALIKIWIKNNVPLYIRERILLSFGKFYPEYGVFKKTINHFPI